MANIKPRERFRGDQIVARDLRDHNDQHRASQVVAGQGIIVRRTTGGTIVSARPQLARRSGAGGSTPAAVVFPFQVYQQDNPSDPDVATQGWRTIRVRAGLVNNISVRGDGGSNGYSTDDDTTAAHTFIKLPTSSTVHIWLAMSIVTTLDDDEGKIDLTEDFPIYIDFGAAGWAGYPDEPNGDSVTGAPPSAFYVRLCDATTSNDTIKSLTTTFPQPVETSLWVDEVSFGNTICSNGWISTKRMSARRV